MICVYPADCTDFSTNGNGTLAPLSAEVTETVNDEFELTLVHSIDEAGKWQRLVEDYILRAPVPATMSPTSTSPRRVMTIGRRSGESTQTSPARKPGKVLCAYAPCRKQITENM